MSDIYSRNLVRSIPVAIGAAIFAIMISYLLLPTNVGFYFWSFVMIGIVSYYIIVTSNKGTRKRVAIGVFVLCIFLILSMFVSPLVFQRIDNAEYFDEILTYTDGNELPFNNRINGSELRVVDRELAVSIMDKTNPFGSNRRIVSVHLGNYQGNIYWIGAGLFDGLILNDRNNRIIGFILVDITDPTQEPIIINQEFELDSNLIFNHDSKRAVWYQNMNYLTSENSYFSYNDETEQMELIVPYSIQDSAFLGNSNGGFVTSDMELDGGVMIFGSDGNLIRDYSADEREELPLHAQIQLYSETWLESQIGRWGRSLVADNDVRWSTALPWVRSERLLGIDDDIRVVINPDTFRSDQYVLLDSTDSTNQILRGAIKANISGLFYYNFEKYGYIDTNSAHSFAEKAITSKIGTSTHGYKTLLPILYPVKQNVTTLEDYAYVMPLQLGDIKFGGIAIVNPADKSGSDTVVQLVETEGRSNVSRTVSIALDRYIATVGDSNQNDTSDDGVTGTFEIQDIRSYEEDGSTIYAMEGLFNSTGGFTGFDGEIRILFSQEFITNEQQWLEVVFANVNDVLNVSIEQQGQIFYAISVNLT